MNDEILELALNQLDGLLIKGNLSVEIVICGAYAIKLHGFERTLYTQDVDSVTRLSSPEVLRLIHQVGNSLGLSPNWLNDQASTVPIPEGALARAAPLRKWKAICASLIDRADLIKMKASAFSIRREETLKDWEDLRLLNPTKKEIEDAIRFMIKTNSPPLNAGPDIQREFEETVDDLKKLID